MKIRNDWGMTFMAKFNTGGAVKGSEREAKQTSATKTSSGHVESANKSVKTAPRCSSQQVRQETLDCTFSEKSDKQNQEELDVEIDITKIMNSMKRGKRSAQRGSSEPWLQQLDALQFTNVARRVRRNDRGFGSKKMKRTRRCTNSWRVKNRVAKGKKHVGGEGDASTNQSMGCEAQTNATEHLSRPNSDASSASVSPEVEGSKGPSEISLEQAAILMNNTFLGFTKSQGAVADDLMDTTDVISLYQDREKKCTKFDPAIIPGLDLNDGAEKFDTSTAESALASLCSLCAVSVPDSCVEFAVKILKDETPLQAEVLRFDGFLRKNGVPSEEHNCRAFTVISGQEGPKEQVTSAQSREPDERCQFGIYIPSIV